MTYAGNFRKKILNWHYLCAFLTSGNSIQLPRNFARSRIFARLGKIAGFWLVPDSGATLESSHNHKQTDSMLSIINSDIVTSWINSLCHKATCTEQHSSEVISHASMFSQTKVYQNYISLLLNKKVWKYWYICKGCFVPVY